MSDKNDSYVPKPGRDAEPWKLKCGYCGNDSKHEMKLLYWKHQDTEYLIEAKYQKAEFLEEENITRILASAQCGSCEKISIFSFEPMQSNDEINLFGDGVLLYPDNLFRPPLPKGAGKEAIQYHKEAALVAAHSQRAAAALLRLAIEALCRKILDVKEGNLSDMIKTIDGKHGLGADATKAMDAMRIIGNNAVHPGEIRALGKVTTENMFDLVEFIYEKAINLPQKIEKITQPIIKKK